MDRVQRVQSSYDILEPHHEKFGSDLGGQIVGCLAVDIFFILLDIGSGEKCSMMAVICFGQS